MTLKKRLERLECGTPQHQAPSQIVIYGICPQTRERVIASFVGGETLQRNDGETEAHFEARLDQYSQVTVFLPDNGRG